MINEKKSEKGQAIVFLVLGLVVFMGFVALAVDGGMAFADRRHSQNGADASSLAGGGAAAKLLEAGNITYGAWNCTDSNIQAAIAAAYPAAIARASTNNFSIDTDPSDGNGVSVVCGTHDYGYIDKFIDVTVNISSTTETSFAQLLFPDNLVNRVNAVTRVRPRTSMAYGQAIVALNPEACSGNQNGAVFGGNGGTYVDGGGIWSNGCLVGNGSSFTATVEVGSGGISYVGDAIGTLDNFDPDPEPAPYTLPPAVYEIGMPDCDDPAAFDEHDIDEFLEPGLYCVDGNLRFNANDVREGTGVTIVVLNGDLTINGGAEIDLHAPGKSPDPAPAVPGLLFYVPNGDITINGNSNQDYTGLIYCPGRPTPPYSGGNCIFNGDTTVETTLHVQIICWNVDITGNAGLNIVYDDSITFEKPTSIELYR